jgi:polysaccharide biosynthesis protein PslG
LRGKSRLVIVAVAIAGLMLAACPPGGSAKPAKSTKHVHVPRSVTVPQGFLGTMPPEFPSDEELTRMHEGGIDTYRIVWDMGNMERQQGVFNWTAYDGLVADAARHGITVFPLLFGVPKWISPNPARLPLDAPAHQAAWQDFVTAAAQRYGPGGTFWSAHPELPSRPLVDWEVWNEPNINAFVAGVANAPRYAYFLSLTSAALHRGNPRVHALVAGLYRRPKKRQGQRMVPFLQRLYRVPGFRRSFDGMAIHPYATKPIQALRVTQTVRRIMNRHGNAKKPLYITELGWTTGGSDWATSLYRATPTSQAERLSRSIALLTSHRRALRLRRIFLFSWRDYVTDGLWPNFMGLFTTNGQPKPAWAAVLRLTHGQGDGPIRNLGKKPAPQPPPRPPGSPPPPRPCFLILCG